MFRIVKYTDGDKEEGSQVTRPGQVEATFMNGDTFTGTYISAGGNRGFVRTGHGVYDWKSGAKYDGQYKNGKRHGFGIYTFPSGEVYEGNWDDGVKAGTGKYIYLNGDVFYGIWAGDKRNGKGRFVYANQESEILGEWKDGELLENSYREVAKVTPPTKVEDTTESAKPATDTPLKKEEEVKPVPQVVKQEAEKVEEKPTTPVAVEKAESVKSKKSTVDELDKVRSLAVITNNTDKKDETDITDGKSNEPLGIIIAGAPASGKGTQCENIRNHFGVVHLSSGDILRDVVKSGSETGKKAKEYMDKGELVPDQIVIAAVRERLTQEDVKDNGFLLDGFPRTELQAQELKNMGIKVHICLMLDVEEEALVERAVGRRLDPETGKIYHLTFFPPPEEDEELLERLVHRADDNEETVRNRIKVFNENVQSLKEFYADVSEDIDANRRKSVIWNDIQRKITNLINIEEALEKDATVEDAEVVEKMEKAKETADAVTEVGKEIKESLQAVSETSKTQDNEVVKKETPVMVQKQNEAVDAVGTEEATQPQTTEESSTSDKTAENEGATESAKEVVTADTMDSMTGAEHAEKDDE